MTRDMEPSLMMPKMDIITAIVNINPTANPTFLSRFSNKELGEYLERLRALPGRHAANALIRQVELRHAGLQPAAQFRAG